MLPPDPPARMPPLTPEICTAEANDMFERWRSGAFRNSDQNPVLWTFAHNPKLADLFSALNVHLLSTGTLPVRERQIAIAEMIYPSREPGSALRCSISTAC